MRLYVFIPVLLTLVLWSRGEVFGTSDWPQFRGPGGQGRADARLPVSWSDQDNLAWKTRLPGYGASSPIALGDRLYVTCYSGYATEQDANGDIGRLRLHVVALDHDSGEIVWKSTVKPRLPETANVKDHGYAASTPVTDGRALYVFFGKTGVFKFDLQGRQVWRADVGSGKHRWGCGTSPVLYGNLVIVNASVESGSLVAIDTRNGEIVWRAGNIQRSWNTPHLVSLGRREELVVSVPKEIRGYDPATGRVIWTCDGIDDYVCPSVISRDGVVYAIGGRSSRAIAVRAGGSGDVTSTHKLWEVSAGANVSSPVIVGDYLYWVSDRNRTAYCVQVDDGKIVYRQRFPGQPYASTMAAGGKLYVVTRHDGTFVLAAQPTYSQLAHNVLDDATTFNASPIVSNGKLFLRSDQFLYCISDR